MDIECFSACPNLNTRIYWIGQREAEGPAAAAEETENKTFTLMLLTARGITPAAAGPQMKKEEKKTIATVATKTVCIQSEALFKVNVTKCLNSD
jgi:hypothetical protein